MFNSGAQDCKLSLITEALTLIRTAAAGFLLIVAGRQLRAARFIPLLLRLAVRARWRFLLHGAGRLGRRFVPWVTIRGGALRRVPVRRLVKLVESLRQHSISAHIPIEIGGSGASTRVVVVVVVVVCGSGGCWAAFTEHVPYDGGLSWQAVPVYHVLRAGVALRQVPPVRPFTGCINGCIVPECHFSDGLNLREVRGVGVCHGAGGRGLWQKRWKTGEISARRHIIRAAGQIHVRSDGDPFVKIHHRIHPLLQLSAGLRFLYNRPEHGSEAPCLLPLWSRFAKQKLGDVGWRGESSPSTPRRRRSRDRPHGRNWQIFRSHLCVRAVCARV